MGMDLGFVAKATGGRWQTSADESTPVSGVSTDTRTLSPGMLYVALTGENHDGHDFIAQGVSAGCAAILADRVIDPAPGAPVLVAPRGTLAGLSELARAWRERVDPLVIGITGSSGKTTLKEMVAAILRERFQVHATKGNLNNHIGLPLTLLSMPETTRILVAEMGMSAPGEIAALAAIARPRIGVVTNVQAAHIEFFDSLEGIARAKGELPAALPEDGLAILPADSPHIGLLRGVTRCRVRTFGLDPATHPDALGAEREELGQGQKFVIRRLGGDLALEMGLPGEHMVRNALAACEAALAAGATRDDVVTALTCFQAPEGRGRLKSHPAMGWSIIDDTYNANPGSMAASLRALGQRPSRGRRVAVLGDMLELGEDGDALHAGLAEVARESRVDLLLLAGPRMEALLHAARQLGVNAQHRMDPAAWVGEIGGLLGPGETILVKGSRGMRMERIVNALLEHRGGAG